MSEVRLNPYLNFPGNCREAFDFYARVLQAEIRLLITMGESPMASEVPAECHNNICHVCLSTQGMVLMGSDCPPDVYEKPQGTLINVQVDSAARAQAIFADLSEGGRDPHAHGGNLLGGALWYVHGPFRGAMDG